MKIPRQRTIDIVLGRRGISTDTALRLGRYFGTRAEFWMNLQTRHDSDVAERRSRLEIDSEIEPYDTKSIAGPLDRAPEPWTGLALATEPRVGGVVLNVVRRVSDEWANGSTVRIAEFCPRGAGGLELRQWILQLLQIGCEAHGARGRFRSVSWFLRAMPTASM